MTRWLGPAILAWVTGWGAGCAYVEERFEDDTGKPAFEVGYRVGETYRLRAEGRIVSVVSDGGVAGKGAERLELWSPKFVARHAELPDSGRVVAVVPAGSIVRVEGLEHNYTFAIPPVPGDSPILRA